MLKQYFSNQTKRTKQITSVLVVLIVAGIGTYLLIGSHAATPYASITADKGTLANGATSQSCTGASDGNCAVFGSSMSSSVILGADGIGGWGQTGAQIFTKSKITGERLRYVMPGTTASYESATQASQWGLNGFGLIMTPTGVNSQGQGIQEPLSQTSPAAYAAYAYQVIQQNPTVNVWELGNEQYFYGTAAQYGAQYLAVYNAVNGITSGYTKLPGKTLMFNIWGDYQLPNGQYSDDAGPNILGYSGGGGWLADAVDTTPGLKADIQAISTHPYGGLNVALDYCSSNGVEGAVTPYALAGLPSGYNGPTTTCRTTQYCYPNGCSIEGMAQEYLGRIPPIYITEYGIPRSQINVSTSSGGDPGYQTSCSTESGGQAYLLTEALNIFLKDSHVAGMYWYDAYHPTSNPGGTELVDGNPEPAFNALVNELNFNSSSPPKPSCNP
jgi:hypothetical protein